MAGTADRIEKSALLPAPAERVWHAVRDAERFGEWFGAEFDGPFAACARLTARIRPTRVDPEIARLQEPYAGTPFDFVVEALEPRRRIVFRWHPYAAEKSHDYPAQPMTRSEFLLDDADKGTRLTIIETGFEALPEARRSEARAANEGGWEHQLALVRKYVDVPGG